MKNLMMNTFSQEKKVSCARNGRRSVNSPDSSLGKQRMWNVGGLVVGSLAALYFFKTVQPLAERGLRNYFFKPTLVSRSVSYHNSTLGGLFKRYL